MFNSAFNSYKFERDRELLDTLRQAIFVLKLVAQNRLRENGLNEQAVNDKKSDLREFLVKLENAVMFLSQKSISNDIDLGFVGFANRFIQKNPHDVSDRLDELKRFRSKLEGQKELLERDFQLLDSLQIHLEEEVGQGIQGLFRL